MSEVPILVRDEANVRWESVADKGGEYQFDVQVETGKMAKIEVSIFRVSKGV